MAKLTTICAALLVAGTSAPTPAAAELLAFDARIVSVVPGSGQTEVASGTGVAEVDGILLHEVVVLAASVSGTASFPVTDPAAAPVTSIRIQASLPPGTLGIDPSASPFGEPAMSAALPLPGEIQVCMLVAPLPPCIGGFQFPLTRTAGAVGVGVGGVLTVGGTGTFRLSLFGAPFTLNTAFVTGRTANGAPFTLFSSGSIGGPALFTSTAGQAGGFLSIVTPTRATTASSGATTNFIPGFLRLELVFVPEPGLFLLLGAGVPALVGLGRRRTRSRSAGRERS